MEKISEFRGEYAFLSNFYEAPVQHRNLRFRNSEAAFQAAKCLHEHDRRRFCNLTGVEAKKLGRQIQMRSDWNGIRLGIMYEVLLDKFIRSPILTNKLLATDDAYLEEGNAWGDTYWGVSLQTGEGENHLGKTLMMIRDALRHRHTP